MDAKTIGFNIRQHRKLKGLTQAELGERVGISTMSIRRYEGGNRIAPENVLNRIADTLGITISLLLEPHIIVDDGTGERMSIAQKNTLDAMDKLNEDGQEKVAEYADDLVRSGKYSADTPVVS